ncbi:MAG: hypothetical protein PHG65_08385, partial [Kiritimatiellae bacterium]|nr:hypothetical protein [Kiritimatiellia bacterium]
MKIIRTSIVVLLFVLSLLPWSAYAQDDLDLESLLSDLSVEETEEASPAPEAQVEVADDGMTDFGGQDDFEFSSTESMDADAMDDNDLLDTELLLLEDTGLAETTPALDSPAEPEPELTDAALSEMSVEDLLAGADEDMADLYGEEAAPEMAAAPDMTPENTPETIATVDELDFLSEPEPPAEMYVEEVEVIQPEADAMYAEDAENAEAVEPVEDVVAEAEVTVAPKREEVRSYSYEEEVRRQALEIEGRKDLQEAFSAYDLGQYEQAIKLFDLALEKIPERPATAEEIKRARWGHAEADYRLALAYYKADEPDFKNARKFADSALSFMPENRAAKSLMHKIEKAQEREAYLKTLPVPAKKDPEVVARKSDVASLIREGRDYYGVGDYDRADALFSRVLLVDPYNTTAMRYLRKIAEKKESISDVNYLATKAKAIAAVRETWTPPIMEDVVLPEKVEMGSAIEKLTDAERLRERMAAIIIPKIEFRDANIQDVVDFLAEASQASDPAQQGINIVLHMKNKGSSQAASAAPRQPAPQDDFGFDAFDGMFDEPVTQQRTAPSSSVSGIALTLNLRRISLLDAIKTITEITGMRYRIDGNIVIISPQGYVTGQVVTRMYPVQPTILDVIIQRDNSNVDKDSDFIQMGGTTTSFERSDVKNFFEKAGVPFPQGTSITYNPGISQLIVANTAENLEIFERILAQLNVIPNQVEIEARFIEISEDNLRELGLEWILNDNWEIATKNGTGPISSRERVQVNKNGNGFTQGLRFFGAAAETGSISPQSAVTKGSTSALGSILSISSILTNPELSVVLHALDQSGGAALLSAP